MAESAEREAIAEAERILREIGERPELSAGAVRRYASAAGVCAALEAQWESAGRPGLSLDTYGRERGAHPLIARMAKAREEAAQLGSRLGLDPIGRMRLARNLGAGRPPGAASAPDRQMAPPRRRLRSVK